jgi:hypothetical protein
VIYSYTDLPEVAAFFMLPFLIKPKARKLTQVDSVDTFIRVSERNSQSIMFLFLAQQYPTAIWLQMRQNKI